MEGGIGMMWVSISEASRRTGVTRDRIRTWERRGWVRVARELGHGPKVRVEDVDAALEALAQRRQPKRIGPVAPGAHPERMTWTFTPRRRRQP